MTVDDYRNAAFNFFASTLLALAVVAALGTQLATTAYRSQHLLRCAECNVPAGNAANQFVRAISPKRPA